MNAGFRRLEPHSVRTNRSPIRLNRAFDFIYRISAGIAQLDGLIVVIQRHIEGRQVDCLVAVQAARFNHDMLLGIHSRKGVLCPDLCFAAVIVFDRCRAFDCQKGLVSLRVILQRIIGAVGDRPLDRHLGGVLQPHSIASDVCDHARLCQRDSSIFTGTVIRHKQCRYIDVINSSRNCNGRLTAI